MTKSLFTRVVAVVLGGGLFPAAFQPLAQAQSGTPCPRFSAGGPVHQPINLFSANGQLGVNLTYQTRTDEDGNALYCFVTGGGAQSPTLRVHAGDILKINLTNALPAPDANSKLPGMNMATMNMAGPSGSPCTGAIMTTASVNIHYHGTNSKPTCHQDEVIYTMINSGESFQYDLQIPPDEPPGLYWYHPHIHGISDIAVQGGASGALIVEGIENVNPSVAGLPEQVLIVRDHWSNSSGPGAPATDLSLNYSPVSWPSYTPPILVMKPSERQFWRVLNASADTIVDLQLRYDGAIQPLRIIALDGVPTNSQDGATNGTAVTVNHVLLAPAARAEFVVVGPSLSVQNATLVSVAVDAGPSAGYNPTRPLARIHVDTNAAEPAVRIPAVSSPAPPARFAGLASATSSAQRTLYFSQSGSNFYITVDGQKPVVFNPAAPPAIVTTQGSVEDWTIQNRTPQNHEFHIHQIHFLPLEQNGVAVPAAAAQYLDTIQIPYWSGTGAYPSVKIRMDFRGDITGDFVYHCHILSHEDLGMMAIIRVNPSTGASH